MDLPGDTASTLGKALLDGCLRWLLLFVGLVCFVLALLIGGYDG
jgi:hypothetical protein